VLDGPKPDDLRGNIRGTVINGIKVSDGRADQVSTTVSNSNSGGGFFLHPYVSDVTFEHCEFSNNSAQYGGAANISLTEDWGSSVNFINCVFSENEASNAAVLYTDLSKDNGISMQLINCLIHDNEINSDIASEQGASVIFYRINSPLSSGNLRLTHCTIANNRNTRNSSTPNTTIATGSTLQGTNSFFTLTNSILWGNDNDSASIAQAEGLRWSINSATLSTSIVPKEKPIPAGKRSASDMKYGTDPLFNLSNDNLKYTLANNSPAIDAGGQYDMSGFTTVDLLGNDRLVDDIDLGCFEYTKQSLGIIEHNPIIQVYPNPAANTLNISDLSGQTKVRIYNLLGKEIMQTSSTKNIDISILPAGDYTLIVEQEKEISKAKFIKK